MRAEAYLALAMPVLRQGERTLSPSQVNSPGRLPSPWTSPQAEASSVCLALLPSHSASTGCPSLLKPFTLKWGSSTQGSQDCPDA